ncbi:circadian clock protein KaiC [Roseimaritima ulvae]|uniref:non-specific serine/threonine protein kinase n=1 Tax=Roseimaritima ulvae TaxID=980254 RepID=A0A5B9QS53_9BACT|nr:circadian clock protein KaiC [Roseimaritima ulvae]QEG41878.1 Circadian clock protein kinase KaiC [Roseimaritima ulvae]
MAADEQQRSVSASDPSEAGRSVNPTDAPAGLAKPRSGLAKTLTGIEGFDVISGGGLPAGRATLVCGAAGCGKTLFGMEFLVRGATAFDEPGVFVSFEETTDELAENVSSLGFDVKQLIDQRRLAIDYVRVERSEIEENGEYDLEGLFVRLAYAIDLIGAKRVVLDTVETLFGGLTNTGIIRSELRRLFRWLKDKGVTAVITGERGDGPLTRHGLEEYVSDCVVTLDHHVEAQVSTRRLRIVKYRGSVHGTNEYPFLIDRDGIVVMPLSTLSLNHAVSSERVSSGLPELDQMLSGGGFYRGSSVLVSGTAGSGKSSLAAHFAAAACRRSERVLYIAMEESPGQMIRNMRSIGLDLQPYVDQQLLRIHSVRATSFGLEQHLVQFYRLVTEFQPGSVVLDPISSLERGGTDFDANSMATRLIDFLKTEGITALMTSLTDGGAALEKTSLEISSLVDAWLLMRDVETPVDRKRLLFVLKSRGMAHSHRLRSFRITDRGFDLSETGS